MSRSDQSIGNANDRPVLGALLALERHIDGPVISFTSKGALGRLSMAGWRSPSFTPQGPVSPLTQAS